MVACRITICPIARFPSISFLIRCNEVPASFWRLVRVSSEPRILDRIPALNVVSLQPITLASS